MSRDAPNRESPRGNDRWLEAFNSTGADIPGGAVLRANGWTTVEGRKVMLVAQHDGGFQRTYFFAALEGIGNNELGRVTADFPALVAYDTDGATPALGDDLGPVDGNWRLRQNRFGFVALEAGADGLVWVYPRGFQWRLAKLDADLEFDSTALASVYTDKTLSAVDSGETIEVHDWLLASGDDPIPANTDIIAIKSPESNLWWAIRTAGTAGNDIVRFKLTGSIGAVNNAVKQVWNGVTYVDGDTITVNDYCGSAASMSTNDLGLAVRLNDLDIYEIIELDQDAGTSVNIVRFELTAELKLGIDPGSDNAETVEWTGAAYAKTGSAIRVRDFSGKFWSGKAGHQGWAIEPADRTGQYEIIWMVKMALFIRGALAADVSGGKASCAVSDFWQGMDPGSTVDVYDPTTLFKRGRNAGKFIACHNDRGTPAGGSAGQGRYEFLVCEQIARYVEFTLTANMTGLPGSAAAGVDEFWDGVSPGATITAHDTQGNFGHALSGDKGLAIYDEDRGQYEIAYLPPPGGIRKGKLDGTLSFNDPRESQTVSIWTGTGNGTDSGVDVTAWDWCLNSGQSLAPGTNVIVGWNGTHYVVLSAAC